MAYSGSGSFDAMWVPQYKTHTVEMAPTGGMARLAICGSHGWDAGIGLVIRGSHSRGGVLGIGVALRLSGGMC